MATQLVAVRPVTRRPWIDKLRVAVIVGVIGFRTATAYVVVVPWYYEERTTSVAVEKAFGVPMLLAAILGLGPLFLIGGWLASASLARHGGRRFVRSRLLRLGVPVLVFLLLIDPVADYVGTGERLGLGHLLTEVGGLRDLGPMWFVVALLAFSLVYVGWRGVRPARPAGGALTAQVLVVIAVAIAVADFAIWLRWPYQNPTPWNLDLPHWPQAAGLFALGVLAGERRWFDHLPPRFVRRCGWLVLVGLAGLLGLVGYTLVAGDLAETAGGWHWPTVAFALLDGRPRWSWASGSSAGSRPTGTPQPVRSPPPPGAPPTPRTSCTRWSWSGCRSPPVGCPGLPRPSF
jgi:Acyltransferase family